MTDAASNEHDLSLIRAMAEGDQDAAYQFYRKHGEKLLGYLLLQLGDRDLAEETLQQVMLAVWNGAGRFRGESRVTTWLLSIARYQALNARRRIERPMMPLDEALTADESASTRLDTAERYAVVRAALAQLPQHQRETLELVFYHDLSGDETAAVMGVAPGTVKSRLHRALAALRTRLLAKETQTAKAASEVKETKEQAHESSE